MNENEEYIPYGKEWQAEMMKLPKKVLINMLKNAFIEKIEAENKH